MEVPTGVSLKRKRKKLGLTQKQLSEISGLTQSVIAKIETESVDPRASTLAKLVEALNRAEHPNIPHSVADLMVKNISTIDVSESIRNAITIMVEAGISQLPVLSGGKIVGIVSESNLLKRANDAKVSVGKIMKSNPVIISKYLSIGEAKKRLEDEDCLLIAEDGNLLGLITRIDILRNMTK